VKSTSGFSKKEMIDNYFEIHFWVFKKNDQKNILKNHFWISKKK